MKFAVLIRGETSEEGTFGTLTVLNTGWSCATAELPWRENRRNISSIPGGLYEASYLARSASGRFRSVYHLHDVDNRGGILIHAGNVAGDAQRGYKTNSNGCILVGQRRGMLWNQKAVLASRLALKELVRQLEGEPMKLLIWDRTWG